MLIVFSPVLIPSGVVLAVLLAFAIAMVVGAFQVSAVEGIVAFLVLIVAPTTGVWWFIRAIAERTPFTAASAPTRPPLDDMAERYRTGDFIHRDYEAEKAAREAAQLDGPQREDGPS
jgi:hypothetical protein